MYTKNKKIGAKMKKTRNQHGFAVVELLLVAIIILAVAGIGYWVYQQRSKSTTSNDSLTSQTSQTKEQLVKDVANNATQAAADEVTQASNTSDGAQAQADNEASSQIGDSANATN